MKTSLPATTVAKINNQNIIVIENGEKRVAVKPICQALGIDYSSQLQKLKADEILSSTMGLSTTVGADKKEREMQTIPFKYVFGWLFRIDSRNVKESARETVLKYQMECYDALYNHFTAYATFVEYRQKQIEDKLEKLENIRTDFNEAKDKLKEAREELNNARKITWSDFQQMEMEFPVEEIKEEGGDHVSR